MMMVAREFLYKRSFFQNFAVVTIFCRLQLWTPNLMIARDSNGALAAQTQTPHVSGTVHLCSLCTMNI